MVTIKMPFQMPIDWTLNDLLERLLPPETVWADLYYTESNGGCQVATLDWLNRVRAIKVQLEQTEDEK